MKVVLFADNHRDRAAVERIVRLHPDADHVVSLGDSEMTEAELTALGVYGVRGNYPFEPAFPDELTTFFGAWKAFLCHGHRYGVKNGLTLLAERAEAEDVDLVGFAHTHAPHLGERDGRIFLNPGSAARPRGGTGATYAVLAIEGERLTARILDLDDGRTLHMLVKTLGRRPERGFRDGL